MSVVFDAGSLRFGAAHLIGLGLIAAIAVAGLIWPNAKIPLMRRQSAAFTRLWSVVVLVVVAIAGVAGAIHAYQVYTSPKTVTEGCMSSLHLGSGLRGDAIDRLTVKGLTFEFRSPLRYAHEANDKWDALRADSRISVEHEGKEVIKLAATPRACPPAISAGR